MLSRLKKASVVLGVATISQLEKHPFHDLLLKGGPFAFPLLSSAYLLSAWCFGFLDSLS